MDSQILDSLGWFRVAVQGLLIIAQAGETCSTSTAIARELRAHAAFLRRVMAQLAHAHIVIAREGRDGGYRLARSADLITLAEIYQALKAVNQSEETPSAQNRKIPVQQALDEIATEIEQSLFTVLDRYTLASLLEYEAHSDPRS